MMQVESFISGIRYCLGARTEGLCLICRRLAARLVNLKRIKCTFCGLNLAPDLDKLLPELGLGGRRGAGQKGGAGTAAGGHGLC